MIHTYELIIRLFHSVVKWKSGYDLRLVDSSGRAIQTWSADKIFAQVTAEILAVEEAYDFEMEVAGATLPDGEYVLEGWLTTSGDRQITSKAPVAIVTGSRLPGCRQLGTVGGAVPGGLFQNW